MVKYICEIPKCTLAPFEPCTLIKISGVQNERKRRRKLCYLHGLFGIVRICHSPLCWAISWLI
jgi:hypothetical protein